MHTGLDKPIIINCRHRHIHYDFDQGRMKFVRPLYRDLYAWEEKRQQAIDTFKAHRSVHIDVVFAAVTDVAALCCFKKVKILRICFF